MVQPIMGAASPSISPAHSAGPKQQSLRRPTHQRPFHTPWGQADHYREYADGIVSVSTASHGGFCLSAERYAAMHEALRDCAFMESGFAWFEEDCDWCAVALAFPEFFPADSVQHAESTLKNCYPDQWERLRDAKLKVEESYTLRERAFYARHRNDLIVVAAWGDWANGVPQGKVGVYAVRGGRSSKEGSYWLIDVDEHESTRSFAFVIDPDRHIRCAGDLDLSRRRSGS